MRELVLTLSIWMPVLIVAVVLHELAHGWVADRCGDPTPRASGRLTLNPFAHIDPIGTVALPLLLFLLHAPFLFGYAKPVPVDFSRLRHPRRDLLLVAVAGPAANFALAVGFAALLAAAEPHAGIFGAWLAELAKVGLLFNLVLGVFNLLPIPPLDGGRVLMAVLPPPWAVHFARIEPWGLGIVVLLLATGGLQLLYQALVAPLARLLLQLF